MNIQSACLGCLGSCSKTKEIWGSWILGSFLAISGLAPVLLLLRLGLSQLSGACSEQLEP